MHILFTRPFEDCKELIFKFTSLGHNVSHLPVINIKPIKYIEPDYSCFKGIIFTSANAIKNLNTSKIDKNIKCFCVGNPTERTAKQFGFQNIFCAEGNVQNLKEIIFQNFESKFGSLIYVSGEQISYNLDKDLILEGYSVKRLINYTVKPVEVIGEQFIKDLKSHIPDIVFIYSENSAKNFFNLISKYQLKEYWMNTNLMCIGEKASSALNEIKWKKIFLFNSGEEEYLLYKI